MLSPILGKKQSTHVGTGRRTVSTRRPLHWGYVILSTLLTLVLTTMVFIGATQAAKNVSKFQLAWYIDSAQTDRVSEKQHDAPLQAPPPEAGPRYEKQVLRLINQARTERGLAPLRLEPALASIARDYSTRMARSGFFDTQDPEGAGPVERLAQAGFGEIEFAREIIGAGFQTPERFIHAVLEHKVTRKLVLDETAQIVGVGYAFNRHDPRGDFYHYWTVDIVRPVGPSFTLLINGGATETDRREVELLIVGGEWADEMRIAESPNLENAAVQPFAPVVPWKLTKEQGRHKVYVELRAHDGRSARAEAEINLTLPIKGNAALAQFEHGPPDVFTLPLRAKQRIVSRTGPQGLYADVNPQFWQTSEFMAGTVAVGVIFPQCNGAVDPCSETWSSAQMDTMIAKVQAGLDWWRARTNNAVSFVIDQQRAVPTSYEPIRHPQSDEGLWMGETLSNIGFPPAPGEGWSDQAYKYNNWLRENYHTDWAYTIFVVNSLNDADGMFANGYFAYAYGMGPAFVMTWDNANYGIEQMPAVVAHETGHIFGALDQYAGAGVPCDATSGYLTVETQNSQQAGCAINVSSIMRGGWGPFEENAVDPYALGQMGVRDLDANGRPDVLDTTPVVEVSPLPTDPVASVMVEGVAQDQPYVPPPGYPQPAYYISINHITKVEYRLDGGAWHPASPTDGAFDSTTENFRFTPPLWDGTHTLEIRAINRAGNVSPIVSRTVTISGSDVDPPTGAQVVQLQEGWNLIAAPAQAGLTASALANAINAQGGAVSQVNRWVTDAWETYIVGYPFNDFALSPNQGVFIRTARASTWDGAGTGATGTLQLESGWNLIPAPACGNGQPVCRKASDLLASVNAQGGTAVELAKWQDGAWVSYFAGYPGNDFDIVVGQAYLLRVENPSSWAP